MTDGRLSAIAGPVFGKAGPLEKPVGQGAGRPLVIRYLREAAELVNHDDRRSQCNFGGDPLAERP
jgi:hypothetical protein